MILYYIILYYIILYYIILYYIILYYIILYYIILYYIYIILYYIILYYIILYYIILYYIIYVQMYLNRYKRPESFAVFPQNPCFDLREILQGSRIYGQQVKAKWLEQATAFPGTKPKPRSGLAFAKLNSCLWYSNLIIRKDAVGACFSHTVDLQDFLDACLLY